MQTCYRHPSETTGVSCSSCGRPICTECMTPTPVGMRCPECAKQKTRVQAPRALQRSEPRVTYALIAINVIVFFAQVSGGGGGVRATSNSVYEEGVLWGPLVNDGEWWRMLTAGFLHGSPIHLLLNMVALWFLGQLVEPAVGTVRYLAIYFTSLLVGSFGALLLTPEAGTVGASGAVFGLMGAAVVLMRDRGIDPMSTGLGPLILLNLLFTFAMPGISIGGHLGGLAGGALAALVIVAGERRRSQLIGVIGCAVIAGLAVFGGITAAGTPSLY